MVRTQIQLPDELYRRAKRFGRAREMSLAEMTRRGLELLLERYPENVRPDHPWRLPQVDGGGLKTDLEKLRDVLAEEEETRYLTGSQPETR